jgi:hypothetical protein
MQEITAAENIVDIGIDAFCLKIQPTGGKLADREIWWKFGGNKSCGEEFKKFDQIL